MTLYNPWNRFWQSLQRSWQSLVDSRTLAQSRKSPRRSCSLQFDNLEDRTVPATLTLSPNGETLNVIGDHNSDQITVSTLPDSFNRPLIAITHNINGALETRTFATQTPSGRNLEVGIRTHGGNDEVIVNRTLDGHMYWVELGDGQDIFDVGRLTENLHTIQGTILVNGGADGSTDHIFFDDQRNTGPRTWNMSTGPWWDSTTLECNSAGLMTFSNFEGVNLLGGGGVDTVQLRSTQPGARTNVMTGGEADIINVGDANLMFGIRTLSIDGEGGNNTVTFMNQDQTGRIYTFNDGANDPSFTTLQIRNLDNTAWHPIHYRNAATVNLHTGSGRDIFNVQRTAHASKTYIAAGAGDDVVRVGDANLMFWIRELTINGELGNDSVTFNNLDQTGRNYAFTPTGRYVLTRLQIRNTDQTAWHPIDYFDIENVTLNTGFGNDIINVERNFRVDTNINAGSGNDTINVGDGTLNGVGSTLTVNGQAGTDTFNVLDQANPYNSGYTITGTTVTGTHMSNITYGTMENLILNAAAGANRIVVSSTTAYTTINAGGGIDMLVGPNLRNTWLLTGSNTGMVGNVNFTSTERLLGGDGDDTFAFFTSTRVSSIDGGIGTNTLDYSLLTAPYVTSPVTVNLTTGAATFVAGGAANAVSGIWNVTGGGSNDLLIGDARNNVLNGGAGHDILVGNGGNDTLNGGAGNDVLIGGLGADRLDGGADDDLLINGYTTFDANVSALREILAEWSSARLYATRIANLRGTGSGIPLNGISFLRSSGSAQSVFDDSDADALIGGLGMDWFFDRLGNLGDSTDRSTSSTSSESRL